MATNYPGSLDTTSEQPLPSASTEMDDAGFEHDVVHTNHSGAIIALETKLGTGLSTSVANSVLTGTGAGTSSWSTSPSLAGLSVDTDTLHVDATNNRVGIGTTSPETPLNIVTTNKLGSTFTGTTDGEGLRVDQSDYTAGNYVSLIEGSYDDGQTEPHVRIGAMFDGSGSHLAFGTTNSYGSGITNTALFIDQNGNVGIGTESPVAGLDIATTAGNTWTSNGWDSGIILNAASALRWRTGTGVDWGMGNSGSNFYIMSSTDSGTGAPADYRMFIGSTGLVGVGTTSPGANLDVKRTGSGAWQRGIRVLNADMVNGNELMIATGRADSARNMGQMYFAYTSSGSTSNRLSFGLHSADDVLNITGASRVGIGTTAPSDTLHVNGTFRASGNVVAMYEYHDNVANRSINSNTTLYTKTITTQGNTRLIMQFVTGQFIKSTSVTNLNIRWSMDGYYLTAGDQYLETNHIGYGANNFREQLVTTANTGTLSAGNHTLRVFAESYGNHTVTLNYQGAARSSHVYVWEVCV